MSSPKLPPFAGRCRVKWLTDAAVFAANEALEKAAFAPVRQPSQRAERRIRLLLLALLLSPLLALACAPVRALPEPERAQPSPKKVITVALVRCASLAYATCN